LPKRLSTTGPDPLLRSDLTVAFMLLTRLPARKFSRSDDVPDMARCVWVFPVVGLAVGLAGGLCYWLASRVGVPPLLAAAWSLAAMLAITGGFHEDGLADTADGFGGATPARKLEIMRDSRIGSYGALALLLSSLMRLAAVAAVGRPGAVVIGLVLAGMLGRSAMVLLLLLLPPARPDGMGASMGRPRTASIVVALAIAGAVPFVCLPAGPAVAVVAFAAGVALVVARLAATQISGYTGDVLGASEVAVECVVLTVLASAISA
jgi:adenosylcobinamide-GDP ribazoletransferase